MKLPRAGVGGVREEADTAGVVVEDAGQDVPDEVTSVLEPTVV
jgi:hypothetical protein